MPVPIQTPQATAALVEQYGLKGRFIMSLDDVVVPTVLVGDVRPTQFQDQTFQWQTLIPATVGEIASFSLAGGQVPDFPYTLRPLTARVQSVGTAQVLDVRPNNAALYVLTAPVDIQGISRINPVEFAPSPVVGAAGTIAAATGTLTERIRLPADTDVIVDLEGWQLGPGTRILFFGSVLNVALRVSLTFAIDRRS